MRVIFWQNIPSIHQAAHVRALAESGKAEVLLVAQDPVGRDRAALGWGTPDFGRAKVIVSPDRTARLRLVLEAPAESTHIFSGIRAYPMVREAFLTCLRTEARMGLLAEPPNGETGPKGIARRLLAGHDRRCFSRRVAFILAIGHRAVRWYRRCGYPQSKIYPYGYFVEAPPTPAGRADSGAGVPVQLLYLGRCIPSKGVDVLLRALGELAHLEWVLTILGDGPAKEEWRGLVRRLGLAGRVRFEPARPNPLAMATLSQCDLLVLPSKGKEGWGAVVNEALMRGVPVLCSENCGATDLLHASWRGEVFPPGSISAVRDTLARWIPRGARTWKLTERIQSWSRCIEGDAASAYLLDVIDHSAGRGPRPIAPWLLSQELTQKPVTQPTSILK